MGRDADTPRVGRPSRGGHRVPRLAPSARRRPGRPAAAWRCCAGARGAPHRARRRPRGYFECETITAERAIYQEVQRPVKVVTATGIRVGDWLEVGGQLRAVEGVEQRGFMSPNGWV